MLRPRLALVLLTAGCHHATAGADAGAESPDGAQVDAAPDAKPLTDSPAQSNRPEVTLTGSCPQPAPVCRRRLPDGTCDREQPAICADAFWLCPPGTFPNETCLPRDSDAAVPPDTAADTAAIFGCPKACPAGQVCAILDYFSGGRTGSCVASPAQCRPEAGAPDAGALSCNQCVGFTVCRGAFGCLTPPGGALYTCGI